MGAFVLASPSVTSLDVALDLAQLLLSCYRHGCSVIDLINWEQKQRFVFLWGWVLKALMHFLISWVLGQTVTVAKGAEGDRDVCPHQPVRHNIKDDISLSVQEIIKGIREYSEEQGGDVGGWQNRKMLEATDYKKGNNCNWISNALLQQNRKKLTAHRNWNSSDTFIHSSTSPSVCPAI